MVLINYETSRWVWLKRFFGEALILLMQPFLLGIDDENSTKDCRTEFICAAEGSNTRKAAKF